MAHRSVFRSPVSRICGRGESKQIFSRESFVCALEAPQHTMALFQLMPIPNYIYHFPYRQLIILKILLIFCAIFQCILWWDHRRSLSLVPSPSSSDWNASVPSSSVSPPPLLSSTIKPSAAHLPSSSLSFAVRWAPICNLLSLLFTAIAVWFMLQKFFWAKLDISLSLASLVFSLLSLLFSSHFYIVDAQLPGLLFALLNSLMLYLQSFSILTALRYAKNCVSNLFIKDWGAAEFSYMEVRELESDF